MSTESEKITLDHAAKIGDALLPRFKEAMGKDLSRIEHRLRRIEIEITRLKVRSGMWGAATGLLGALAAMLLKK